MIYYSIKVVILDKFIQVTQKKTLKESLKYLDDNFKGQSYQIAKMKKYVYKTDELIKIINKY